MGLVGFMDIFGAGNVTTWLITGIILNKKLLRAWELQISPLDLGEMFLTPAVFAGVGEG